MAAVLRRCLNERKGEIVTILCNSLYEVELVQPALLILNEESTQYVPYLKGLIPTAKEKQQVIEKLGGSSGSLIFISDYRSFRGSETSNSIIVANLDETRGTNIYAETVSRTMAGLAFIALPKIKTSSNNNQIGAIFNKWKDQSLVKHTIVNFGKENRTEIIFKFQSSDETDEKILLPRDCFSSVEIQRNKSTQEKKNYL